MSSKENEKKQRSSSAQVEMSLTFLVGSALWLVTLAFAVGFCMRMRCNQLNESEKSMCQLLLKPSLSTSEKYLHFPASTSQDSQATCKSEIGESAFYETCSILQDQKKIKLNGSRIDEHSELDSFGEMDFRDNSVSEVKDDNQVEEGGQHLTVDVSGIDADFIQSENRLFWAMTVLAKEIGLKFLSYEYHDHGRGCVSLHGFLTKSRISVTAWPKHGVIAFDLFSHGSNYLLPILDKVKEVFGISSLQIRWTYKERGHLKPEKEDLAESKSHKNHEFLEKIASVQSPFQRVDIYDTIHHRHNTIDSYMRSLETDKETYESQNPQFFVPDRVVYLDDVMQSRRRGENAYHEALVHPVLMGHENPRRVAIIGGGEGATLREVLKHNTIEKVYMIEIDEVMVNVSKTHIPEWSDCSNLVGSEESCYDDPRAELVVTDAIRWFMDRFLHETERIEEEKFDVIILDALDPSGVVAFSDILYGSNDFMHSLYNALNKDGILISQVGEDDDIGDPDPWFHDGKYVINMQKLLQDEGFEYITFYAEANSGFLAPWSYMVSFKETKTKKRWYANQAEIDLVIQSRGLQTKDSSMSPFQYFDGSSMVTYQFTGKVDEILMCRADLALGCELGHGFNPETPNAPLAVLQQGHAPVNHTYEALEAAVAGVLIPPQSIDLVRAGPSDGPVKTKLSSWIDQLGCTSGFWGGTSVWAPTDGAEVFGSKSGDNNACPEWKRDESALSSQPFLERNYMAVLHSLRALDSSYLQTFKGYAA